MNNKVDNKFFYLFVVCITLSIVIIGATFAFFTASSSDDNTVNGVTGATGFKLSVSKITSLDMTYGLVPMRNTEAPYAAEQLCYDDRGSVGCQIYKITLNIESEDVLFVDGFITTDVVDGIETRFTRVYPKVMSSTNPETGEVSTDNIFTTNYTKSEMLEDSFDEDKYIKSGNAINAEGRLLNKTDDYDCLFVENEQLGGGNDTQVDFYLMIWIWDDGTNQDFIQGNELVYTGTVTFVTAQGNEIKATFD